MGKHWCFNGTMVNTDRYSSPVPWIGIYIAAASSVCLVMILCDIYLGFRRKKSWLPCRFFSLNSITLTLLSISTKLPVDLTSPMPSSQDQLSKLTGTIFLCMSMTFLMPSVGIVGEFEGYSNMVALSIFTSTVVVNICIQMATGVIFSFIVEHAIILFCLLVMLVSLWNTTLVINDYKEQTIDKAKHILRKNTEESLLQKVKICYLQWYDSSPQLAICLCSVSSAVNLVCIICVVVLAEVLLRSLAFQELKFCAGASEYAWSVWSVVVSQIVTIAAISFAIGCRWVTYGNFLYSLYDIRFPDIPYLHVAFPFYTPKCLHFLRYIYGFLLKPCGKLITNFVIFISINLGALVNKLSWMSKSEERPTEGIKTLLKRHNLSVKEWILKQAVEDMERWVAVNTKKRPQHLINLLATIKSSPESLTEKLTMQFDLKEGSGVCCLSILLLVEMAKRSIPNSSTVNLMADILSEVFPIIYFIDKQTSLGGFKSKVKSMTAKILFSGKVTSSIMRPRSKDEFGQSQSKLLHALGVISNFHCSFVDAAVREEACAIVNFFGCQRNQYTSLNELHDQIKNLFVDMLGTLLSKFPKAILNYLIAGPPEDYEQRLRLALKYICQLELLESFVRWSFPTGSKITGLINSPGSIVDTESNTAAEDNIIPCIASVTEDSGEIQVYPPNNIV